MMNKKKAVLLSLSVAAALAITGCGKKDVEEPKEDENIEQQVEVEEDVKEEEKEEVEEQTSEEDSEDKNDKEIEKETIFRVLDLTDEIIEDNFEKVQLKDFKISGRTEAPEKLYIADLYLHLDVDNKEEAEKLIEEYSETFMSKFDSKEDYEEVILIWSTPAHEETIEKEYYEK